MKSRYLGQTEAVHASLKNAKHPRIGVLLINLGTPEAPTPKALRRYLAEFLADPRVVEIPRLLWLTILHGLILRIRPKKSAKLYQNIWTEEGSPLLTISQQQLEKVKQHFGLQSEQTANSDIVAVELAMRYGNPSISDGLKALQRTGVNKLIILPLYPQYAGPTTASSFDAVIKELSQWRWIPHLTFIHGYHDHPLYIQALAYSIREHIEQHGRPDQLLISYHGMPKQFLLWGDPYYCFCQKTSRLLTEALSDLALDTITCFQSRFGKAEWLQPYTSDVIAKAAKSGKQHIAVISPAFSVDCLETLDELQREARNEFVALGGKTYHYIPALNDSAAHIKLLATLINTHANI